MIMANIYNDIPESVDVICTDNDRIVEGQILHEQGHNMRVSVQGIVMLFKRHKPGIYVANMSGKEFVIKK